jgi:hypothetical protein
MTREKRRSCLPTGFAAAAVAIGVAGCAPADPEPDAAASDSSPASLAADRIDAIHAIAASRSRRVARIPPSNDTRRPAEPSWRARSETGRRFGRQINPPGGKPLRAAERTAESAEGLGE